MCVCVCVRVCVCSAVSSSRVVVINIEMLSHTSRSFRKEIYWNGGMGI